MQNAYLPDIIRRIRAVSAAVKNDFSKLDKAAFNWKPDEKTWSVGEILEHIIVTNECYFPLFQQIEKGSYKAPWLSKIPGLKNFWGNMLLRSITPVPSKKVPTTDVFRPKRSAVPTTIIQELIDHNETLIGLLEKSDQLDHRKTGLTSPAASMIVYSLNHAVNILANHEERHLYQARSMMDREDFGKV